LLHLEGNIQYSTDHLHEVSATSLPAKQQVPGEADPSDYVGNMRVTGWGSLSSGEADYPNHLKLVDLPYLSDQGRFSADQFIRIFFTSK
jgi:hypothetical protein